MAPLAFQSFHIEACGINDGKLAKELLLWANQFNSLVRWDCACYHLATSTVQVMETCFVYLDWLDSCGFARLGPMKGLIQAKSKVYQTILGIVLRRLAEGNASYTSLPPMDGRLMTSSSQKLSSAALILMDRVIGMSISLEVVVPEDVGGSV